MQRLKPAIRGEPGRICYRLGPDEVAYLDSPERQFSPAPREAKISARALTRWRVRMPIGVSVAVHTCLFAAVGLGVSGLFTSEPEARSLDPMTMSWEFTVPPTAEEEPVENKEDPTELTFNGEPNEWEAELEEPSESVFSDDITEEVEDLSEHADKAAISRPVELQHRDLVNASIVKPPQPQPATVVEQKAQPITTKPLLIKTPPSKSAPPATATKTPAPVAKVKLATPQGNEDSLRRLRRLGARNQWKGTVIVRVRVSAAGRVIKAVIARSSGSKRQDEATREAVSEWAFRPATRGDEAAACTLDIPFAF